MRLTSLLIFCFAVIAVLPAFAQEGGQRASEIPAQSQNTIPVFEDYAVESQAFEAAPNVDVSKYEHAVYKELLVKNYKSEPNLANKYVVITVACGSNCQTNFIANKETGKIIDDIGTTFGLQTQVDSSLLIADAYQLPLNKPFYKNPLVSDVRYYLIVDDVIKPLTQISHKDYYNAKQVKE